MPDLGLRVPFYKEWLCQRPSSGLDWEQKLNHKMKRTEERLETTAQCCHLAPES